MNGHELWRLRELGIGGLQVQKQQANFWSKYNCPVLRWTGDNPRHGFDLSDNSVNQYDFGVRAQVFDVARLTALRDRPGRITLPMITKHGVSCKRSSCSISEPPAKQRRYTPSSSVHGAGSSHWKLEQSSEDDEEEESSAHLPPSPADQLVSSPATQERNKGNWYFLKSSDSLREACANAFPQLAHEHCIDLGQSNKIFAARWLRDDRIVMGTKCNSVLVMDADLRKARYREQRRAQMYNEDGEGISENQRRGTFLPARPIMKVHPLEGASTPPQIDQNCGIHAIDVNPSGTLLASGGDNPANLSVFQLPNFEPLTVGESAHSDWLFDLEWLDDEYLVSGSRDNTLALWRFPNNQDDMIVCSHSSRLVKPSDHSGPLSGGRVGASYESSSHGRLQYPSSRPIEVRKLERFDKVRALKYNRRHKLLTSVSLNSYLHILDITTFRQKLLRLMEGYNECVCLCNSPDEDLLTVGSRTAFAFYDTRTWELVGDEQLPRRHDEELHSVQTMIPSGVRSASWHGNMLTLGTGGGEIMFYDVRARKFLQCDCNRSLTLKITGGWLLRDEIYQEIFMNLPCPNAVYAHCYDEYGTRLFAAGGPIAASLVGNYAAMWG